MQRIGILTHNVFILNLINLAKLYKLKPDLLLGGGEG